MLTFSNLINFLAQGLEVFGLFYAEYEAEVTQNDDPEKRSRIKVVCKSVLGDSEFPKWVSPKSFFMGNGRGMVHIPDVGESVLLTFRNGNPSYPIWSYRGYAKNQCPDYGDNPLNFLIQTKNGTRIFVDEDKDLIQISTPNQNQILLDDELGKITVENPDGGKVELTNIVVISGNEIHLGGTSNDGIVMVTPLVNRLNEIEDKHNALLANYKAHIHPHPQGATTPTTSASGLKNIEKTLKSQLESTKVKN